MAAMFPPTFIEVRGKDPGLYDPHKRPPLLRIVLYDLEHASIAAATATLLEQIELTKAGRGQFAEAELGRKLIGLLQAGKLAQQVAAVLTPEAPSTDA